uniref:HTH cro/C1-type domain-containing protein n=1 Tax=mine drainage metagenome TaxID=410659 RepID=E6Q012_9ZZZZ
MSLSSKKGLTERIRRSKEARARLVSSNLDKGIAFQIRATRDKRKMTQAALAAATGMTQNNISRIEDEDYGRQTLSSLKRVAEALDVALVVRFVPFSQYIDWLSGTPFRDEGIRPAAMAVPSFEEEEGISERALFSEGYGLQPVHKSSRINRALAPEGWWKNLIRDPEEIGRYDSDYRYLPVLVPPQPVTRTVESTPIESYRFNDWCPTKLSGITNNNVPSASGGYANASPYEAERKAS